MVGPKGESPEARKPEVEQVSITLQEYWYGSNIRLKCQRYTARDLFMAYPGFVRLRPAGMDRRLLKCSYLEQGLLRLCCETCHAEHHVALSFPFLLCFLLAPGICLRVPLYSSMKYKLMSLDTNGVSAFLVSSAICLPVMQKQCIRH